MRMNKQRQDFENWASEQMNIEFDLLHNRYKEDITQMSWLAWKAAKNQKKQEKNPCNSKVLIDFPTNKYNTTGETFLIRQSLLDEFMFCYQGVNIWNEILKMRAWLFANDKNRKTSQGMKRFINSWLSKAQNQSGSNGFRQQIPDRSAVNRVKQNSQAELERIKQERYRYSEQAIGRQGNSHLAMEYNGKYFRASMDNELWGQAGSGQSLARMYEGDYPRTNKTWSE